MSIENITINENNNIIVSSDSKEVITVLSKEKEVILVITPGPKGNDGSSSFISGSGNNSGSFSGSFEGNGSRITGIISSSYAVTASYVSGSSSNAISSSYSLTSSYSQNSISASYALTASFVQGVVATSSYSLTALSSSYVLGLDDKLPRGGNTSLTDNLLVDGGDSLNSIILGDDTGNNIGNFTVNSDGDINLNAIIGETIIRSSALRVIATSAGLISLKSDSNIEYLLLGSNIGSSIDPTGIRTFGNQIITSSLMIISGTRLDMSKVGSITGSIFSGSQFTGSFFGTASSAQTSSYALTASFVQGIILSASYATSSANAISASYIDLARSASNAINTQTSSIAITSSYALTASFIQGSIATSSYSLTSSFLQGIVTSASYALTASFIQGIISSASYATSSANAISASYIDLARSASNAINAQTSSIAITSSYAVSGSFWSLNGTSSLTSSTIMGKPVWSQSVESSTNTFQSWIQANHIGGTPTGWLFKGGTHITLAASTESNDINFNLGRIVQFTTSSGIMPNQRAIIISAPTYSFATASLITKASTLSILGPPTSGLNSQITNSYAIDIESGKLKVGSFTPGTVAGGISATIQTIGEVRSAGGFNLRDPQNNDNSQYGLYLNGGVSTALVAGNVSLLTVTSIANSIGTSVNIVDGNNSPATSLTGSHNVIAYTGNIFPSSSQVSYTIFKCSPVYSSNTGQSWSASVIGYDYSPTYIGLPFQSGSHLAFRAATGRFLMGQGIAASASLHVSGGGIFTENLAVGMNTTGSAISQFRGSGTGNGKSFLVEDNSQNTRFVVLDTGSVGINTSSPLASLHVIATTTSSLVYKYETLTTGNSPNKTFIQGKTTTVDSVLTPILTQSLSSSNLILMEGTILGRRTGGVSGSSEDSVTYKFNMSFINTASLATLLTPSSLLGSGMTSSSFGSGSLYKVLFTTGSNNIFINVSGSQGHNITWHLHLDYYTLFN